MEWFCFLSSCGRLGCSIWCRCRARGCSDVLFKTLLKNPNPEIVNGKSRLPTDDFGAGIKINELELKKFN